MTTSVPRVQVVGLLPAILQPCGPSCARPFMGQSVETLEQEELAETPASLRENADRAHALAEQLLRDFGDRVRIEVVGLDSPRGMWIGLRHRIGHGFAVVVDGKHVLRNPDEYEPLKTAVEAALAARAPA